MKITNMFTPHSSLSPRLARRLAVTAMFVFGWLPSVVESRAATLSWTGGGGANANWNNSANWGGTGTPGNGDTIIFQGPKANLVNTNNLVGLTLSQIRFEGTSGGFDIRGNAFTLTNNIECTNAAGANSISNSITLATADQIVDVTSTLTLAGTLSGSVGLTKTGAGTLLYQGPGSSTYTGSTRVNAGTLQLNVGGVNAFGGPLIIGDGSGSGSPVVRLLQGTEIPDNQPVTVNLGGLLDLNNLSDTIGPLTIQGATVATGSGQLALNGDLTVLGSAVTPVITGNLRFNGGMRVVSIADGSAFYDLNLFASVSDAGGGLLFTNDAPSATFARLLGNNSFTGPLIIDNITLTAETPTALGGTSAGTTVGSHGRLWLYSTGITNESLTMAGGATLVGQNDCTWAGPILLNGDVTMDCYPTGSTLDLDGTISGSGGINKIDQGTVRLSGTNANTYGGTTLVSDGTLELNKVGTIGSVYAVPGAMVLSGGTTARLLQPWQLYSPFRSLALTLTMQTNSIFDLNGHDEWLAQVSMTGAQITGGGGVLFLSGDVTVVSNTIAQSMIRGDLELFAYGSSTNTTITNTGHYFSADLVVSANISSSGANTLFKEGDGEVELSGTNNTYAGATIINGGDLWVDYTNGLGNTTLPAIVNNGATLILRNNVAIGLKPLTLSGNGYAFGALVADGNNSWAGDITLASSATINCFFAGNNLTLSGAISGPGALTLNGAGTVTLTGSTANTYGGITHVSAGTLALNKTLFDQTIPHDLIIDGTVTYLNNNQVPNSANVTINGLLNLNNFVEGLGTINGNGNITFGTGLLDMYDTTDCIFGGGMSGTGVTGIEQFGTSKITLNGNNTYTGTTRVASGELVINGLQPQSAVRVDAGATLGGAGTVGAIAANGRISPGNSPGILTSSNVIFSASGNFTVELTGPNPGVGGYDQLNVRGTNNLANATLTVLPLFTTPVAIGQQFIILNNDGVDAITGTFNGLPEGAGITTNGFKFKISYLGNTGNAVVLTLTNVPLAQAGSSVSLGNGNGTIDPNECDYLSVVITNQTGTPITGVSATLLSTTPNVAVTQPFSTYPDVPGSGKGTNTAPFQISTSTNFVCGTTINLVLTVATASHGSFSVPVVLSSGSGFPSLVPLRYDLSVVTNIPDVGTIESTNVVSGFAGPLEKVAVSIWLTHPIDSDLSLSLISPDGTLVQLALNIGAGANFGSACSPDANRTTFDDSAATPITAASPPFVGTFRPQGTLGNFINTTANGNWRLRITDSFAGSLGALRCWSLFLYPAACTAGGGLCELCPNVTITAATGPATPTQINYLTFNGTPSTCGVPKVCPGTTTGGTWPSDNYTFQNGPSDACVTVTVEDDSPTVQMLATVYSGSYNPANADKCINYLADGGNVISSANPTQAFSFTAASNATFVVNIISSLAGVTAPYKLTVSGGDCRPVLNITPVGANNVRLDWTTAAAGYGLESTNQLVGSAMNWSPVTNVPVVVNRRFQVTNNAAVGNKFYHLHKP